MPSIPLAGLTDKLKGAGKKCGKRLLIRILYAEYVYMELCTIFSEKYIDKNKRYSIKLDANEGIHVPKN